LTEEAAWGTPAVRGFAVRHCASDAQHRIGILDQSAERSFVEHVQGGVRPGHHGCRRRSGATQADLAEEVARMQTLSPLSAD
jgi:hypothetical protein